MGCQSFAPCWRQRGIKRKTCGCMILDIWRAETAIIMRKRGETGRSRLKGDGAYDDREIKRITAAIANHSDKHHIHNDYDELLKDADVMDHCFYNPDFPVSE